MTDQTGSPRTRAGKALHRGEIFDLASEEDRRRLAVAIESEAQSLSGEREGIDVLASIRELRITSAQIHAALDSLGPTGDKAEAYVKVAALATADALAALASLPTEGGER